jgi:hypothetical protein
MKKFLVLGAFVALLAMLVTPLAVFAVSPSPQTVALTGTEAAPSITFTAPTIPPFGTFVLNDNTQVSSADGSVTVTANSGDPLLGWTVQAQDLTNYGYMRLVDSNGNNNPSGTWLNNKLVIGSTSSYGYYADGTGGILTYTGSGTETGCLPLYVKQNIVSADSNNPGAYAIVITYTLTPSGF